MGWEYSIYICNTASLTLSEKVVAIIKTFLTRQSLFGDISNEKLTRQDPNTQMEAQIPLCGNRTVWQWPRKLIPSISSFLKIQLFDGRVAFPEEKQNKFDQSLMPEKALATVIFLFNQFIG